VHFSKIMDVTRYEWAAFNPNGGFPHPQPAVRCRGFPPEMVLLVYAGAFETSQPKELLHRMRWAQTYRHLTGRSIGIVHAISLRLYVCIN